MAKAPRMRKSLKYIPKDVRGHIVLGQTFVMFEVDGSVQINGDPKVSADEMAALAHINELLRRLRTGKILTYDFDPLAFQDNEKLVSCEWLPSGNLKLNMEDDGQTPRKVHKRYDHAYSIAEAMAKHRTFTCTINLYMMLPRRRAPREMDRTDEALLAAQADIEAGRTRPAEEVEAGMGVDDGTGS